MSSGSLSDRPRPLARRGLGYYLNGVRLEHGDTLLVHRTGADTRPVVMTALLNGGPTLWLAEFDEASGVIRSQRVVSAQDQFTWPHVRVRE